MFVNGVSGNQVGTPLSPLDPVLGPLDFDPSGALMHAILNGSPAKDAGDPTGCKDDVGALLPTDQRGISRPQGPYCDIGAYEAVPPVIENQSFSVAEASPNGTLVGTVAASDADGTIVSFAITARQHRRRLRHRFAGDLTVANSAAINPAVNPSFALTVVVTDNDGYTDIGHHDRHRNARPLHRAQHKRRADLALCARLSWPPTLRRVSIPSPLPSTAQGRTSLRLPHLCR